MRLIWIFLPLLLLCACKESPRADALNESEIEPKISYSSEVRPLLIESCLSCHPNLPLHNPEGWDLLHQHKEAVVIPELLYDWVEQGSTIDPHWANLPLRPISGASVDDFLEPTPALKQAREVPQAIFSASVSDILAGDLMSDKSRSVSTGYLRQGEDNPKWRTERVARELLGVRANCAKCHDHPSEHWTTKRYAKLEELFTTPYDHLTKVAPPLFVKSNKEDTQKINALKEKLKEASKPLPLVEQDYLNWLALDEGFPSLPGLVAAYSFEGDQLSNLSSTGQVKAAGQGLIAQEGAHGQGLYFEGENKLVLSDLPAMSELDRFSISSWIKLTPDSLSNTPIFTIGTRQRGFELRAIQGKLQARWSRFWPQIAASVTSKFPLIVPDRWSHIVITYDGTRLASGFRIYLNGHPIGVKEAPSQLMKAVLPKPAPFTISGKGLSLDELQIYNDVLSPLGVRQVFDGRALVSAYLNGENLREFYQNHMNQAEPARRQQVRTLNEKIAQIESKFPAYLVMAENPNRKIKKDSDEPANRLEFAERLNKDLLARSLANEVWRRHFGAPLAHSLGFSDPLPAHSDLLEWLAGELRKNDFNISKLGELIRSSKAWAQEWTAPDYAPAICPRPTE